MVIPTLGTRPEWLLATVTSIVRQADVELEIVIVTPQPETVQSVAQLHGLRILHSETPGISAAVNEGWAELLHCDYLAWLGDDDLLAPDSMIECLNVLENDQTSVASYGRVRYIGPEGDTLFVTYPGIVAAKYLPWGKDLVPQPGSLFRRSAIENLRGGLDETLKYAMDYDLFIRLQAMGRLAYVPREVAAFRLHPGSVTGSTHSGQEAEEVRARTHSVAVNRSRKFFSPIIYITDRVLYKILQHAGSAVPTRDGREYTIAHTQ